MITLNFDEVLERTYNAKKGVDVRYGLGQGFEYCKQFADEAQGYAANAKASEKKATDAVAGIEQTKTDAVQAVQNAQTTATDAVQQAQSTATTAVTTKQTEAVQAVGTAQTGAVKAVDDERDAALQQVADSTATAKGYAESAASAANAAGNAATAAGGYASNAKSSATAASGSASAAATSESNAASSAQSAETDADRAEAAAELAGTRANTDKTLKTENAPADAKTVGDIILDAEGNVIFYSKAAVNELLKKKLGLHDTADAAAALSVLKNGNMTFHWEGFAESPKYLFGVRKQDGDYPKDVYVFPPEQFQLNSLNGVVASGSDYVRFGDGTQICWKIGSYVDGYITETNRRVNFPVPFLYNPAVLATSNANVGNYTIIVGWESTTGFSVGVTDANAKGNTNWIAIGRWK